MQRTWVRPSSEFYLTFSLLMQSPESAEHLCGKCDLYAAEWKKAADELWAENPHHKQRYENYKKENLDEEAKASTEEILFGIRG